MFKFHYVKYHQVGDGIVCAENVKQLHCWKNALMFTNLTNFEKLIKLLFN